MVGKLERLEIMGNGIIKQFSNIKLENGLDNMTQVYLEIAEMAEELVNASYEMEGRKVEFPIDVYVIAKYLGIEIELEKLNKGQGASFNRILSNITVIGGMADITIDDGVGYKTQRYAIANSIGRVLLNQNRILLESNYAIPLIPQSLEEIAADVIALFLLLPIQVFKDEFMNYLRGCEDYPLDVDVWLEYLGNKSQISQFNLAIGYQQLKQVLCYQRQKEFSENNYDISKLIHDPYDQIYA